MAAREEVQVWAKTAHAPRAVQPPADSGSKCCTSFVEGVPQVGVRVQVRVGGQTGRGGGGGRGGGKRDLWDSRRRAKDWAKKQQRAKHTREQHTKDSVKK